MRAALALLLLWAGGAAAEDAAGWRLRSTLKAGLLLSRAEAGLPQADVSAASLWRVRLEPECWTANGLRAGLAYEQRLRQDSGGGTALVQGLRPEAEPMLRWASGDTPVSSGPGLVWRQELDRAWVSAEGAWGQASLGRQAVGWGRGLLFSPADIVAPFSPLEADREWRRGVDALRLALEPGAGWAVEALGLLGPDAERSAGLGRLRKDFGRADLELMGGVHLQDGVAGLGFSAPVGDFELHGELLAQRPPQAWSGGPWGGDWVPRGMLGASISWTLGERTLLLAAEAQDNGFGAERAGDLAARLRDPAFGERLERGQLPVLARHAGGLSASLDWNPELSLQALWIFDGFDGSGIVSPGLGWALADSTSLSVQAYLPYGPGAENGVARSFYGDSPLAGFVQIKIYR